MIRTLGTLLIAVIFLGSCTKGDKVPSYLIVPSVDLSTSGLQGSNTKNITDTWVYVNDEFMGSWELPARIPVLKEGSVNVRVDAGAVSYTHLRAHETVLDLVCRLLLEKKIKKKKHKTKNRFL